MGLTGRVPGAVRKGGLRRWSTVMLIALSGAIIAPLSVAAASSAGALVSVIVRGQSTACTSAVDAAVAAHGGTVTRALGILDGGTALVPSKAVAGLRSAPCVAAVTPDATLAPSSIGSYDPQADTGSLYNTTLAIGAQAAWAAGYTGQGIGVALIDTGVTTVRGLRGPGQVINGVDVSFDSQTPGAMYKDGYGHGTHMAGIIAGNDVVGSRSHGGHGGSDGPQGPGNSPGDGHHGGSDGSQAGAGSQGTQGPSGSQYAGDTNHFLGVAPDAHIINVKVGDQNGVADVSQMIAAIDWVVQHRDDQGMNIKVINLSYGTPSQQSYVLDPLAYATEVAWQSGIVVVAAAGNGGSNSNGLADPAYDPYVIAVGAADTQGTVSTADDTVASFSSTGDGVRNPDVVAPGVHIESLRDPGSVADHQSGNTATIDRRFFLGSGTSQAAAIVSGAVALLLSAQNMNPDQVKRELMLSATLLANTPDTAQGAGEINVPAAIAVQAGGSPQSFASSTGLGTLEGARGGVHVLDANGVALTGEMDIFGNAWDSACMASAEQSGTAWSGGTFNGAAWSGSGWSNDGWAGAAWSGGGWANAGWSGAAWSGAAWSGAGWSGAAWSGAAWSDVSWS